MDKRTLILENNPCRVLLWLQFVARKAFALKAIYAGQMKHFVEFLQGLRG